MSLKSILKTYDRYFNKKMKLAKQKKYKKKYGQTIFCWNWTKKILFHIIAFFQNFSFSDAKDALFRSAPLIFLRQKCFC